MDDKRRAQILADRERLTEANRVAFRQWRGPVAFGLEGDCADCPGPLPPQLHQGNPRRWCSEACRAKARRHGKGGSR